MTNLSKKNPVALSIGILASNAEEALRDTLASLFRQSVFEKLSARHQLCEILVLAHGSTDRGAPLARAMFDRLDREHACSEAFVARVIEIPEPGRSDAWNRFVHEFSAVEARFIALLEPGITLPHRDTLHSLMATLENRPYAAATTARPCKAVLFKERRTLAERVSLATSAMTSTIDGRLPAQLYCLRAKVARNLYLPRDLAGSEEGFFKQALATDFFSRGHDAGRIVRATDAVYIHDARLKAGEILAQQQREVAGQAGVHVLVEYIKTLPAEDRLNLADTLRHQESRDAGWLKKLLAQHLRTRPFCWQLFPGLLTFRFRRCGKLPGVKKLTHFPAACAGALVTLLASVQARRVLRRALKQPAATARPANLPVPQGAK